ASPVIVTLASSGITGAFVPLAPQTLNPGEQLFFSAQLVNESGKGVTWSISPASDAGSLTNVQPTSVFYTAPTAVTVPITANITATSVADPSTVSTVEVTVFPSSAGANVTLAKVNGGPVAGRARPNSAYTSVALCNPGSVTACQKI